MKYDVVIVASGKGVRANLGYNKVFHQMKDGKTVLDRSIDLFYDDIDCNNIIVVTNEEYFNQINDNDKLIKVLGGEYRKDSVFNGLMNVKSEYVFVHDGARPYIRKENIDELKEKVVEKKAVILGHMASDTVKQIDGDKIVKTIDRETIFLAETPQVFETELLRDCYKRCKDIIFTDEASLVESLGYEVYIVKNSFSNPKLTIHDDFNNI